MKGEYTVLKSCMQYTGRCMKQSRKALATTLACGLVAAMAIGGTFAYLTDEEVSVNTFTVGKVQIDLEEPNQNPDDTDDIVPNEVIKKDPQVENTGTNKAYVFVEVKIPTKEIVLADETGAKQDLGVHDLFTYGTITTVDDKEVYTAGGLNEGWSAVKSVVNTVGDSYSTYIFGYNKPLAKGETTLTVFDRVKFANIVEGQIDSTDVNIPIKAYAIQAEVNSDGGTTTIDGVTIADANNLTNQELKDIYSVFATQNPDLEAVNESSDDLRDANTGGAKDLSGNNIISGN